MCFLSYSCSAALSSAKPTAKPTFPAPKPKCWLTLVTSESYTVPPPTPLNFIPPRSQKHSPPMLAPYAALPLASTPLATPSPDSKTATIPIGQALSWLKPIIVYMPTHLPPCRLPFCISSPASRLVTRTWSRARSRVNRSDAPSAWASRANR